MYTLQNDRIVNDAGEVAVRWRQETGKYIQVGKREYVFTVRTHVSLAWINPEDVDRVLSLVHVCCGGNKASVCKLASLRDVQFWMGDF